ncbi:MAG: 2-C-methyl-D-erythritol 4-phosphate cytidylyltransferase [Deltaproteobacteria bacterium]|nr:2-C-methyl-D-erythritol 4-phosphate cytidylyltransferase [Deltaproteobacteria bacterium]
MNRQRTLAVIPSAGLGRRMGSRKKNYLMLSGRPVLAHTLSAFEECPLIDAVVIAAAPPDVEMCGKDIVEAYGFGKVVKVVAGGAERQDSVANALKLAAGFGIIAVHDGARPLVTPGIIEAVVGAAVKNGAAIAAVALKDTIKEASRGMVRRTVDRENLLSVQTPQAFRTELLLRAFEKARQDDFLGTDESSLVERLGEPVSIVEGSYENIKITTAEDMAFAEWVLRRRVAPGK